jgi:hypothetical protein
MKNLFLNTAQAEDINDEMIFVCPHCGHDEYYELWEQYMLRAHVKKLDPSKGPGIESTMSDCATVGFGGFYCAKCDQRLVMCECTPVRCDYDMAQFLRNIPGNENKYEEYVQTLRRVGLRQSCSLCPKMCDVGLNWIHGPNASRIQTDPSSS